MPARRLLLDGDYGVDDAIAALYLAAVPEVEIVAVGSVRGNTEAATAARNAITVLDLAGLRHVPVAVGAARPLAQPLEVGSLVHGGDGLGGAAPAPTGTERAPVAAAAAVQIVDTVRADPGRITIVATGPLTNLALAVLLAPDIVDLVEHVVVMGGTLDHPGNVGPYTEANIGHDPEAADLVFGAGWPLTLVGLDATMATWLEPPDLARLRAAESAPARFVVSVLQHYLAFYRERHGREGCPLHDPTAARIAVDPGIAEWIEAPVRVELNSTVNRGMLVVDRRPWIRPTGPPVRIVTSVDRDAVVEPLVAGLLSLP